jgi:hypothetical protein
MIKDSGADLVAATVKIVVFPVPETIIVFNGPKI